MLELETRQPPSIVFRLGRRPDAWQAPDWAFAHTDGTFGNRFDDPQGYYRVLYASTQRLACFVETLARFRPDLSLLAELSKHFPLLKTGEPEPEGLLLLTAILAVCISFDIRKIGVLDLL